MLRSCIAIRQRVADKIASVHCCKYGESVPVMCNVLGRLLCVVMQRLVVNDTVPQQHLVNCRLMLLHGSLMKRSSSTHK